MSRILELRGIHKSFVGLKVLDDVSLAVEPGEVHALVGENGAGKSTLINLISGVHHPDRGQILLGGQPVRLNNPVVARRMGIVTVHQEADLFASLSVAENMALQTGLPTTWSGRVRWRAVDARARAAVEPVDSSIDVRQPAGRLSVAQRHLSQISAAFVEKARLVILDEPTSVLTLTESEWLFAQMDRLRRAGVGIIYISHRQEEIFRLSQRISVLRDGRRVWSGPTSTVTPDELIHHMVGRHVDLTSKRTAASRPSSGVPRLSVRGLSAGDGTFQSIDVDVHAGEIVGLYGLVGSGRTEFAHGVFGLQPVSSGTVCVDGEPLGRLTPERAVRAGIGYVPEDRLRQAVCRGRSIRENSLLATINRWGWGPFVWRPAENRAALRQTQAFRVRMRSLNDPLEELSGGNQQKVILGRWMLAQPSVLILDEPTRGVDVAAKAEIHSLVRDLADAGTAVLMISSELPEVMAHADRIGIFRDGQLVTTIDGPTARAETIAQHALPESAHHAPVDRPAARRTFSKERWSSLGLLVGVVILIALLASTTEGRFTNPGNLWNLANNLAPRSMLALSAAVVILAGGIDISLGSFVALSAAVGGLTMNALAESPWAIPAGIAAGVFTGVAAGLFNGAASHFGRIHPIVVTLGTMTIGRGLVIAVTGSGVVSGLPDAFGNLASTPVLGVSGSIILAGVTFALAWYWLHHTRSGRHIYALGNSPSAAHMVGVSRAKTWLTAFTVSGLLVGLVGLLELAQNRTMQPTMAVGYELRAIAAAVIGGIAIDGGRGSVFGVVLGALVLVLIENGLVLWQVSGAKYDLVIGSILLAAILIDRFWGRARS